MEAAQNDAVRSEGASFGWLLRAGAFTVVVAVVANVLLRSVAVALLDVSPEFTPLWLGPTILFTAVGVLGAVVVFATVARFSRRPVQLFGRIALIALLVSFVPDVWLLAAGSVPGTTLAAVGTLMVEHVAAWAVSVGMLTALARQGQAPGQEKKGATMAEAAATRRGEPTPRLMRLFNNVPKVLLRSPLHRLMSKNALLLTFAGRKSGRSYTVPLSYVQDGDMLYVSTQSPWWKNLRQGKSGAGARVRVRLRGQDLSAYAEAVTDERGVEEGLRIILAAYPGYGRFIGVPVSEDGRPDEEALARAAWGGRVLLRVRPTTAND